MCSPRRLAALMLATVRSRSTSYSNCATVAANERPETSIVAGGVRSEQFIERNSDLTFWDGLSGHANPLRA